MSRPTQAFRVWQCSDFHLFSQTDAELKGIKTWESFRRTWQAACKHLPEPDLIIVTGDLAHDELRETYRLLRQELEPYLSRLRVLPGNHDHRGFMREVFGSRVPGQGDEPLFFEESCGSWRLLGLDSHVPGELWGQIRPEQYAWLEERIATLDSHPLAIFLHHPPVRIGSPWLDDIMLSNPEPMAKILQGRSRPSLICTGHVHQEFATTFSGAQLLTCCSTSVQFKPNSDKLIVDDRPPGLRYLEFAEDSFQTKILRAETA